MSASTNQKSLAFMEAAGPALAAAQKFASDVNVEKQAATKLADALVPTMIQQQLCEATEEPMLRQKLATHNGAIEVLGYIVSHHNKVKKAYAQKLAIAQGGGSPAEGHDKAANADRSNGSPYVGQRAGLGERRPSDEPFLKLAGLAN